MTYQRKTKDVFVIQSHYGVGCDWEDENEEPTRKDGKRSLREYRENGQGLYRMVKRRERIVSEVTV